MTRLTMLAVVLLLGAHPSDAYGQNADEVKRLKEKVELLEAKLKLAEKENDLLKKEVELLKAMGAKGKPDGAGEAKTGARSLSDLLPSGKVLEGNWRGLQGDRGEITVTISERDKNKFTGTAVLKRKDKDNKDLNPSEAKIEGEIYGDRLTWKTVGDANKTNATLTLKGDGLEGTWRNQTGSGTVGLKLSK